MKSLNDTVVQNPVIYFFLCDDEQIPTIIANEQSKYFDTIKYIIIDEFGSGFLEFIDEVHGSLIKHEYRASGAIRINCFYSYKKSSHLLFSILSQIESGLSDFYPGGIMTDVYVYFDELDKSSRSRLGTTLHGLAKFKDEINMIYLFSCINSKGLLIKENMGNIYKTISSLFFIKDTVTPGQGECFFDERYFKADAMVGKGDFFAAGSARLSIPLEDIGNIVTARVIDEIIEKSVEPDIIWNSIYTKSKPIPAESIDNLRYIAVNTDFKPSKAKGLTNGDVIESAFGSRLQKYYKINIEPREQIVQATDISSMLKSLVTHNRLNIFEIYNSIKKGTRFDLFFSERLDIAGKKESHIQAELKKWLDYEVDYSELQSKTHGVFKIAKTYIDMLIEALNRKHENDRLKSLKAEFDIFISKADLFYNSVLIDYENKKSQSLISLGKLSPVTTTAINEYYNDLTEKYLQTNMQVLNNYLTGFSELTGNYYEFIKSFCAENIIGFLKNTKADTEIMNRLNFAGFTNDAITTLLTDSIISMKVYNLNIKSEDSNKQVEISIILNIDSPLAKYIPVCNEKSGRFKISAAFDRDKNDIDILYQMGAFQTEELYYSDFMNERQI